MMHIFYGMKLRTALKIAKTLGCVVYDARRTGEVLVRLPNGRRLRINARRDTAPRELISVLRRLYHDEEFARGTEKAC